MGTRSFAGARRAVVAALLTSPVTLALAINGCSDDDSTEGPSVACPGVSVSIPAAYAAPVGSGGALVTIGGTATGCPVAGVSLYGIIPASSVGSSFASWTASVPLTVFASSDAGDAGGAGVVTSVFDGGDADAALPPPPMSVSCPSGSFSVPVQVLVTLDSGIPGWVGVGAPCVPLYDDTQCAVPTAALTGAVASPASSSAPPSILLSGNIGSPSCPVQGVTVANAYVATPVVSGYGAWTAIVPLTVFESFPCGSEAGSGYAPPVAVLAPTTTGLSEWVGVDAGCIALTSSNAACSDASVSVASWYPAPASSGPPALTIAGNVNAPGCPVSGVTLLDTYVATAVGPTYAAWTATVPLAALEQQPSCIITADAGADAGTIYGYLVTAQIVTPIGTGLTASQSFEAGCVPLSGSPLPPCDNPSVTVNAVSPQVTTATGPGVVISGAMQAGACPVAGLVVMGGYAATPLASNYAAWSATVPTSVAQAQASCLNADAGTIGVPIEVIVPGNDGLPVAIANNTACTTLVFAAPPDSGIQDATAQ